MQRGDYRVEVTRMVDIRTRNGVEREAYNHTAEREESAEDETHSKRQTKEAICRLESFSAR